MSNFLLREASAPQDLESSFWVMTITLVFIIILFTFMFMYMKPAFRKYRYIIIKKALEDDNRKLITDQEDIEYIEYVLKKYEWYSKNWWVNITPTYVHRWNKFKKIVKKYNLDIDVTQYPKEKEK